MKSILLVMLASAAVVAADAEVSESGIWKPLFDGKSLEGWVQRGGKAEYRFEEGAIIGRCAPNTPNSFLCTDRSYTNFVLELEFKIDPTLNSGVQIRSHCFDKPTTFPSKNREIKVPAGRVHGLQVEIDPSARAWTGGVFEEGARGWLNDLRTNSPARLAFQSNSWNHFQIRCQGNSIRTWINKVPAADLKDDRVTAGFIALQVHGVRQANPPREVRFRNIRIRELE